jgi:hypothetical protein
LITSGDGLQPNQGLEHSLPSRALCLALPWAIEKSTNLTDDILLTLTSTTVNNNYHAKFYCSRFVFFSLENAQRYRDRAPEEAAEDTLLVATEIYDIMSALPVRRGHSFPLLPM